MVERKVAELVEGARAEMARVEEMGGAVAAVESGYMKGRLVGSLAERRRRMESGDDVVVGVNRFDSTEPNPLTADLDAAIMVVDPAVEAAAIGVGPRGGAPSATPSRCSGRWTGCAGPPAPTRT